MSSTTIDPRTFASNPGKFRVSQRKLQRYYPELFSTITWLKFIFSVPEFPFTRRSFWKTHIEEHLQAGDSRAAIVINKNPLLIAAYSDETDCVVVLNFPNALAGEYKLEPGTRLLTVNTYASLEDLNGQYESDIIPGERATHQWGNFFPYIADFLTDDKQKIAARKTQIDEEEWERTGLMAEQYLRQYGFQPRNGHPLVCGRPAESLKS